MKPEELMLGDIVTFKDCQNDKEPVIIKIWSINQDGEAFAFIDDDESVDEIVIDDEIVGLPLTPEILEKNGFVNVYRGRYRFDDDKGSIVEVSTVNNKIKWVRVSKYDEDIEEQLSNCTFDDMHFVHELQHALRLCRIEKTIEYETNI